MILCLVLLLGLSAFVSAAETALFSLSSFTLKSYRQSHSPRLQLISRLMERPADLLVTILMLNILANILVQNTMSMIFKGPEGDVPLPQVDWLYAVGFPLMLTLVFGEVLPKALSLPNHTAVAYFSSPLMRIAMAITRPVRVPLTRLTHWVSRAMFFFLRDEKEISEKELRHVLKTSEESGVLLPAEARLVNGTLDLQHSPVKEHMRPREEILFYDVHKPLQELIQLFTDRETTRIPVCDGSLDNLLGILTARRFFFQQEEVKKGKDVIALLRRPYFVPESMGAWTLLRHLRGKRQSLAMVVDEYGSISGLATQEDLIEAVTGKIASRHDAESLYTRSSSDAIIASGKLELQEFKEIFGVELESEENVTLGGWLIEQLGDIPAAGTRYATDRFLFYVLAAEPHRIQRIYVRQIG